MIERLTVRTFKSLDLGNPRRNGYDFDTTMLRIGSMNMLLHGVENPDILPPPRSRPRWASRRSGARRRVATRNGRRCSVAERYDADATRLPPSVSARLVLHQD